MASVTSIVPRRAVLEIIIHKYLFKLFLAIWFVHLSAIHLRTPPNLAISNHASVAAIIPTRAVFELIFDISLILAALSVPLIIFGTLWLSHDRNAHLCNIT